MKIVFLSLAVYILFKFLNYLEFRYELINKKFNLLVRKYMQFGAYTLDLKKENLDEIIFESLNHLSIIFRPGTTSVMENRYF